ncbi:MAG TPA: universal stress protein [Candidatus Limnocylindrales bacterium]|nr:universal stress protein [Candidatus Limnocylindrales bacterium]
MTVAPTQPTPRLAPGARAVGSIRLILLATDLSPASDGAAAQGLDLAHDLGADVLIMSAIDPRTAMADGVARRVDHLRIERELAAQDVVARGRARGVHVRFLIWEGAPGEAIVDVARSEQVDMVVVGSHGRGAVGRFFIGSVSEHVVRHAPCPVLVVRG